MSSKFLAVFASLEEPVAELAMQL